MTNVPPVLKQRARTLRTNATDAERALWHALRPFQPRFTRQFVIADFIVDFACRSARLIVELDGGQHDGSGPDESRTRALGALGWKVVRFWNNEVLENRDGVVEVILGLAASRVPKSPGDARSPTFREPRGRTRGRK